MLRNLYGVYSDTLYVSSHLLCLYSLVCVEPVRKPHYWCSHEAAQIIFETQVYILIFIIPLTLPHSTAPVIYFLCHEQCLLLHRPFVDCVRIIMMFTSEYFSSTELQVSPSV